MHPNTLILSIDYNMPKHELKVRFKAKPTLLYTYSGVPVQLYFNLRDSFTPARDFMHDVRGHYDFIKTQDEPKPLIPAAKSSQIRTNTSKLPCGSIGS